MSDTQEFNLEDSFLKKFKGKQPAWGPLGYITYKRTYARKLDNGMFEEFWQTLKRVVEGTYRIQQKHCLGLRLPWSNSRAQKSAQEMFTRMWEFKFLPPGRGLWSMGTEVIDKVGGAALNNCAMVSTQDIKTDFASPFCFLMDMSMLGVGVAGDTRGEGTITIKKPIISADTFVVPDTREGWVDLTRTILDSYVRNAALPTSVDFSQIRPAGTSIKTFGGTASGSKPLEELVDNIHKILNPLIGCKITSTAIVDLFNVIGRCVVSGNVRRSAELMLGDPDDTNFLELKDPDKHPEQLKEYRWASNNSILATVGMDYSVVAPRTAKNGEPGYFWLENAQAYGRLTDTPNYKDESAMGTNPCQPAFAKVLTPNGIRRFSDIEIGSVIWSGQKWTKVINKWQTGSKPVYSYRTSAGEFIGTENHKVVENDTKVEVQYAESIDIAKGQLLDQTDFDLQTVIDGLVLGDGGVKIQRGHKDYKLLYIGKNDTDYFTSDIAPLIGSKFDVDAYNVTTTLESNELTKTYDRTIPERFLTGNEKTLRSFLRGLYTANGSVVSTRVTLKTASANIRDGVQYMLSALGIQSYFTTNKEKAVEFSNGTYQCKESYDINISTDRDLFLKYIGFVQKYKEQKLLNICATIGTSKYAHKKANKTFDIKTKTYLGDFPVWDITVDADEHTYWTGGVLVSNCSEQTLFNAELCCLVESFPANHDDLKDYLRTLKFAYLYGKTVTLVPTHDSRTNAVMLRNRRIGMSQSGIVQSINKIGMREHMRWCDEGYKYLQQIDKTYSDWLCIPTSIKTTSVKPSGSVSLLPGATPGIHYPHSEFYIRNIRCEKGSTLVKILEKAGYPVEDDYYSPNTSVVSVPVHEKHFSRSKADVSMWEQLELTAQMQAYWADNQVSVTITFKPEEAKDIKRALELYETRLKSVSFLPADGGGYKQAPYIEITEDQYKELTSKLKPYDLSTIKHEVTDAYCDSDKCTLPIKTLA